MKNPEFTLHVRFRSKLTLDQVMKIMDERSPEFRALEGLQQKYYLLDAATGEYAGLYLWESQEALTAYRKSELRASIAKAYQAEGEPRVESTAWSRPYATIATELGSPRWPPRPRSTYVDLCAWHLCVYWMPRAGRSC